MAEYRNDFVAYLERHEDDIAWDINDYGDLREIFIAIFSRPPKKDEDGRKPNEQRPQSDK